MQFLRPITVGVLVLVHFWAVAASDETAHFARRRETLMKRMEGGVAVLQGAAETRAYQAFRQSNDFYYLTGVETPGAMLLVDATQRRSILFLPPRDGFVEAWEGPRLVPGEEAKQATGFAEVLEVARFQAELEARRGSEFFTPLAPEETATTSRDRARSSDLAQENSPWDGRTTRERAFERNLKRVVGNAGDVKDLSPILDGMRRVKDAQEIGRMREAGRIGSLGLIEAMRAARPGVYEYQIASLAEFVFKWNGAFGPGYFAIVGSGPNSCILHYHANSRKLQAGEVVVMDFGPDYRYYQSDITRTFPVSGKFSPEQANLYGVVLRAYKAAVAAVRPGATFRDVNAAARAVVREAGLQDHWAHGVSHYVGMSTHDPGAGGDPFEPGVALTIEPGLYIRRQNLGIRIEDSVLVTAEGCEILSKDLPRELAEIESLMKQPGILR